MSNSFLITDRDVIMAHMKEMEIENITYKKNEVNGMMAPRYTDCNIEDRSVTLEFDVHPWEVNRKGILHGGLICTMLDHVTGTAIMTMGGGWCPTVDMDVRFLKSGMVGDTLVAVGRFVSAGKRVLHMEAKLYNKETGDLIATSTSTFLNTINK